MNRDPHLHVIVEVEPNGRWRCLLAAIEKCAIEKNPTVGLGASGTVVVVTHLKEESR